MVIQNGVNLTIGRAKCIDAMLRFWYPSESFFEESWISKKWLIMPVLVFGDCHEKAQQEGESALFGEFIYDVAGEIGDAPSWVKEGFKLNEKLPEEGELGIFFTQMTEYSKASFGRIPTWTGAEEGSNSAGKEWMETLVTLIYVHQKILDGARQRGGNLPFKNPHIYDNPVIFK